MTEIPRALLEDLSTMLRQAAADDQPTAAVLDNIEYLLSALLPTTHHHYPAQLLASAVAEGAGGLASTTAGTIGSDATLRIHVLHTAILEVRSLAYSARPEALTLVERIASLADLLSTDRVDEFDDAVRRLDAAPLARSQLDRIAKPTV